MSEREHGTSILGQMLRVVGSLLIVTAGAAGAVTALLFLDTFRLMSIDSVFGSWESRNPVESIVGAIAVTAVCTPLGAMLRSGSSAAPSGSVALWTTGAALAGWVLSGAWTPPDVVGTAFDPTFGDHAPWGAYEWVWYSLPWTLPAACTIAWLVAVIATVRHHASSGRRRPQLR